MENVKEYVSKCIIEALDLDISEKEILDKIEEPKEKKNGDLAYPCFNLAKLLKNSPVNIANDLKESINVDTSIDRIEAVSGYLNFYLNSSNVIGNILKDILKNKEKFGSSVEGNGKNIVVDYSSPNIAKPFHLGHLRTTVIGRAIYNAYKELGYNVIGINYLGDWGRQFGLVIEGYKRFKDEYNIENDPLHILSDIYVRISNMAKEDESVMDAARDNFKKLEEGNEEYIKLWQYFKEISMREYLRIYDILGCKFDSYNGEAYYNDKMDEVVQKLDETGVLVNSNGAKVVNLGDNEPPCIIVKSNGSTIYATRDLAAILNRARDYDFYKAIYVTSYEQEYHFSQIFRVAKYLVDEKYVKGLVHVPYGMVRLKTGKMSTRNGTVIYLQDLIEDSINRAKIIIENKNPNIQDKEKIAKQVGVGALVFNDLKINKIKDVVFDLDEVLRFDGETGPYVQYTYVRTRSILEKCNFDINTFYIDKLDVNVLVKDEEIELIKSLNKFGNMVQKMAEEYEPSILAKYMIDIASMFSKFYNSCTVLVEENDLKNARLAIVYATSIVIKKGLSILGIECPDRM